MAVKGWNADCRLLDHPIGKADVRRLASWGPKGVQRDVCARRLTEKKGFIRSLEPRKPSDVECLRDGRPT